MTDRVIHTPASRATDPVSSHDAEMRVTRSGSRHSNRLAVVEAVRRYNDDMTSAEIALAAGLDYHEAARRLPECVTAGDLKKGPMRVCSVRGTLVCSWVMA